MPVDIVIPASGESVTSGVIARWTKQDGEFAKQDETVLELETDKVTMEIPSPASGVVHHVARAGDTVKIGAIVGNVDPSGAPVRAAAATAGATAGATAKSGGAPSMGTATAAPPTEPNGDVRATPLARKLAGEHGVDLSKVNGTGPGNRVREQDVLEFVNSRGTTAPPRESSADAARATSAPRPAPAGARGTTRERISPLRARIAQRLVQAQHTAAMLTTFNECDMGAVMDLRKAYKDEFEKKHGVGLGFMGFFVRAVVSALKAYPLVNAYFTQDEKGEPAIEKHDYCDIAMAVSTPKGLVVPVVRSCESLSLAQVELAIKDLAARGREGKLSLEEMQGGTFTITNGGVFGSLLSTPILNPPQSAILGLHAIKNRAVEHPAGSGQVAIRPMMYLALSYDHRIIDGAEAVQFLVHVKKCIEDPQRMLLGV